MILKLGFPRFCLFSFSIDMILAVVLTFLAVTEANIDYVKVNRAAHSEIIPNAWKEGSPLKAAGTVNDNPTMYLVMDEYTGSTTCGGVSHSSIGTGFGVCIATSDSTSVTYTDYNPFGFYTLSMYDTADCSGKATKMDAPVPTNCVVSNGNGYKYFVKNSTEPWNTKSLDGVVGETFSDASSCSKGGSGSVYSWSALHYCVSAEDNEDGAQSVQYTSCTGDSLTYTSFSDTDCINKITTHKVALSACEVSTDGEYVTRQCTTKA